jgi:hypothetical protein
MMNPDACCTDHCEAEAFITENARLRAAITKGREAGMEDRINIKRPATVEQRTAAMQRTIDALMKECEQSQAEIARLKRELKAALLSFCLYN